MVCSESLCLDRKTPEVGLIDGVVLESPSVRRQVQAPSDLVCGVFSLQWQRLSLSGPFKSGPEFRLITGALSDLRDGHCTEGRQLLMTGRSTVKGTVLGRGRWDERGRRGTGPGSILPSREVQRCFRLTR